MTIKKKKELLELINNFLAWYSKPKEPDEITAGIRKLIDRIEAIITGDGRSKPHLAKYWLWLKWAADNCPEKILKHLGVKYITADFLHNLLKLKFEAESISFDSMNELEFENYHNKAGEWVGQHFFGCSREEMMQEFENA